MNAVRRKMASFLTELICKEIEALNPRSPHTEEPHQTEAVDAVIAEEIEKVCSTATLGELAKVSLLVTRLKRASENEKGRITGQLNTIAGKMIKRVEDKNEPLKLSEVRLKLFSEL